MASKKSLNLKTAASLKSAWSKSSGKWASFLRRLDRARIDYISYSKVSTVERCPSCYYNQYVLGKPFTGDALVAGALFHQAAACFYKALRLGKPESHKTLATRFKHPNKDYRLRLTNAIVTLTRNHWDGYTVFQIEKPFFMDLAVGLPPVIGIPDLVLKQNASLIVVDHKTSKSFKSVDHDQLILYGEFIRRIAKNDSIIGVVDEYRMVDNLKTATKPTFRRIPVSVHQKHIPALISRFKAAWEMIQEIERDVEPPAASYDCYWCNYSWS